MIIPGFPLTGTPLADAVPTLREAILNGEITMTGAKTFAGQIELTAQSAANPTSAMNRDLTAAMFAISPRVHHFTPYTTGTTTGSGTTVGSGSAGSTLITIGTTADASARCRLTEDFGFSDVNAGYTFGFSMPFMLRVPLSFGDLDTTGAFVIRIYACTQGTMTLPAAGSDPFQPNTRGLCAELRKKSTGTGWEARLCARDGHSGATGTSVASSWVEISTTNQTKHVDVLITSNGSGTAKLFVTTFASINGEFPASAATSQKCTLTGSGVPSTNMGVAPFWSRLEVAVIGNGSATLSGTRYIKIYPCVAVYGSYN